MGNKRITARELIEWLGKLPENAEVCFTHPGMHDGTSKSIRDITVKPVTGSSPYVDGVETVIIVGLE